MRRFGKWCGVAALMAAVLVLVADDSRAQQFQFQRPGGGPGGAPDPDAIFNAMAKGQNQINLNDPANAWMKGMRERRGQPIPPNGIITREMFKTEFQQQQAQGGGFGGRGMFGGGKGDFGGKRDRGGFGGPPGMTPPNQDKPVIVQGGPGFGGAGGAPGGDPNQFYDSMFQRSDRNADGKITPDEASGRLRESFAQYDKNRDGAIDQNEFRAYMADRMAQGGGRGPGGPGGGPNGFGGPMGGPQFGQAFQPPQGNWQGGPPPGGEPNGEGKKGKRRGEGDDEEDARPVVYRYGKLPKEIPSWFEQLDTDKDGMVGLYEWRRAGRKTEDFVAMDLNGDGYLTADEWLRYSKAQLEKKPGDDDEEGGERPTISRYGSGDGGKGGDGVRTEFKGKGGDGKGPPGVKGARGGKGEKGGGKKNPFTGG